jgi:hypothetical protein
MPRRDEVAAADRVGDCDEGYEASRPPADKMMWTLVGVDGRPYESATAGTLGGHRGGKLYGRLDCRAAARALARGGYVRSRVFFTDEATAIAAGYRPCAVCLPRRYAKWKKQRDEVG